MKCQEKPEDIPRRAVGARQCARQCDVVIDAWNGPSDRMSASHLNGGTGSAVHQISAAGNLLQPFCTRKPDAQKVSVHRVLRMEEKTLPSRPQCPGPVAPPLSAR